jgi:TonB-linked SusC/RagA family outer membrane protein
MDQFLTSFAKTIVKPLIQYNKSMKFLYKVKIDPLGAYIVCRSVCAIWMFIPVLRQTIRVMKLVAVILLVTTMQVIAESTYAQKVSFKKKDATVLEVLQSIRHQTGYLFVCDLDMVKSTKKISMSFRDASIKQVLDESFRDQPLTYAIYDKTIVVKRKSELPEREKEHKQGQLINRSINGMVPDDRGMAFLADKISIVAPQEISVKGKITDEKGDALPGVSVVLKGTQQGTSSGLDGDFALSVPTINTTLVFSFVGYLSQEIAIGNKTVINVILKTDEKSLEEVVVVGYGVVKKSDLTGSVSVVSADEINKRGSLQVAQALQGSTPGVSVTRSGGAPGDVASIRIRGVTTIGDSNPLVLIDGVPGSINDVQPADIESLSVLKDGASAAIYGARAASGVILITTKRAKSGVQRLVYNYENGFDRPTSMTKYVGTVDYMKMVNEMNWNDNNNQGTEFPRYAEQLIKDYPRLNAEDPERYPDTNWGSYLKSHSRRQSHNLTFSAGQEKLRTLVTMAYDKFGTLTDGREFKRINVRANNDVDIHKNLSLHFNFQYLNTDDDRLPGMNPSLNLMSHLEPNQIGFYRDGRIATVRNGENPWAAILRGGSNSMLSSSIRGQAGLTFRPIEGLKLSGIFAPTFVFDKTKTHTRQLAMTSLDDPNLTTGFVGGHNATSLAEVRAESKGYNAQMLASYGRTINKHQFDVLAGYETNYIFNENLRASRGQYILHSYPYLNLGPLDLRDNSGGATELASQSYFARVTYNYNSKYLIQSNIRRDGSSRFHKNSRWGTFPSVSAGWVLSEESFMPKSKSLSFLKLRASWGMLGNERIGNYPYQSTVSFGNTLFHRGANVVSNQTAFIGRYAIENISWESTSSIDLGIDMAFFNNKLSVTADYFNKTTSKMLLALEIPKYIGLENPSQNTGKMKTKGWELDVRYRNEINKLKYSVSANLSDYKSVMGNLGGTQFLGNKVKFEGSEFDEWYGYKSDGIYQTQDEINGSPTINNRVRPGDIRYKDVSGPNGVPDGIISPTYDRVLLGGSLPRFEYGGNISLSYGGFDFSVVLQGVGKCNSYLDETMIQPLRGGGRAAQSDIKGNYWSAYQSVEQNSAALYPRLSFVGLDNNYVASDYWLINGSYLRVKNILLGYTVPSSITRRMKVQSVRLNCNLIDFFNLSKFPFGIDPEQSSGGYFITKSTVFGISISL